MKTKNIIGVLTVLALSVNVNAEEYKYGNNKGNDNPTPAANCIPASAATELDINNTRALIQSGGDMWWDFNRARYEIPKGSEKTSLFAGSLWLAGKDISGQFKVAALRFRQIGNDYWTGPLSTVNAEIDPETCKDYDRHWETTRSMVAEFSAWWEAGQADQQNGTITQDELYPGYSVPKEILEWPAHGRNFEPYNEDYYLAPFFDRDGDGDYEPITDGDYPSYVLVGKSDCSRRVRDIYGDQNLWWVFNDKGNIHSESGGQGIGMEIRAQAFAFATTDEVNNMTFYNYELINRSTFQLAETYFGQWVDGDLGNAQDDYVGCDVQRGLGYFYNGDDDDQDASGNLGYGTQPPAIGVDFFQGPFQANDNLDNCLCEGDYAGAIAEDGIVYPGQGAGYGDGIVDNERYGMRKFLYHNNAAGPTGDPSIATDYYNMLRGIWRDGTPMTFGENGYQPANPNAIPSNYMFPGDTDPVNWGTDGVDAPSEYYPWTEVSAGNPSGDRRFVQSSGPFELGPGAVNNITVGVVWMQATSGGRLQSVADMRKADDKTQALFDSCFEIVDGPDAPDVTVQELDRQVILMLSNSQNSNNANEAYASVDPFLAAPDSIDTDDDGANDTRLTPEEKALFSTYKFEGYQIYQLADKSVGTNDLNDPDKARLVDQVDIANDVDKLVNFEFNSAIGQDVPIVKVDGANNGIRHSFEIDQDYFATDDIRLINHKTYYYMVIAYAYNLYGDGEGNLQYIDGIYDPSANPPRLDGQKLPYLASRKSASGPVQVYSAIPHKTDIEMNGVTLNSQYGDGVELTRVEGRGTGRSFVNIKEDQIDSMMSIVDDGTNNWTIPYLKYEAGKGPVQVKVVDPLTVRSGEYSIKFIDTTQTGDPTGFTWLIYERNNTTTPIDTIKADQSIKQNNEQILFDLGLSLTVDPGLTAGSEGAVNNGFVGFDVVYEDQTDAWLSGIPDVDADPAQNWIKAGTVYGGAQATHEVPEDDCFLDYPTSEVPCDPNQDWEDVASRTWSPFALASYDTAHPVPFYAGTAITAGILFADNMRKNAGLDKTPNVDVVIDYENKDLWTRCPVIEAGEVDFLNQGDVVRGELRRALSVDKQGRTQLDEGYDEDEVTYFGTQTIADYIADMRPQDTAYLGSLIEGTGVKLADLSFGMGWFPGYAVDVSRGERLNMAFAEKSWLSGENGGDMLWNPTDKVNEFLFSELRHGGMHLIYVFRNNTEDAQVLEDNSLMMPAYDGGSFSFDKLVTWDPTLNENILNSSKDPYKKYMSVFRSCGWVGYPLVAEGSQLFGRDSANAVRIELRAASNYSPYAVGDDFVSPSGITDGMTYYVTAGNITVNQEFEVPSGDTTTTVTNPATFYRGESFTAVEDSYISLQTGVKLLATKNKGLPLYNFNTFDVAPTIDVAIGEDALDNIVAVPNPYYAYSSYEEQRLDYLVKIINLPEVCTINIFTVNGTLVRTFEKDDATVTSIDWDLKNQDAITIASGLYIIHINAPEIGAEKVIKWFGVLRPIDLNSF